MMDSETEKCAKMESQLQEKVTELFAENKILENKISVLNECLSIEKVKKKISDLENKQKMLKNLEGVVNKLKTDIKPLEYLKQVLQEQLRISSAVKELKNSNNSQLTANSGCATETLDSLSVVSLSSEESVEIIPDDDVLDNDYINSTLVNNGKTFDEALCRASIVHSFTLESSVTNISSIESLPSGQPLSRDYLMDTSSTSEQFDVVNEQDFLNDNEHDTIQTEFDTEKIELTVPDLNKLYISMEKFRNAVLDSKECDNPPSTLLTSWVQVNELNSIKNSLKNKVQKCEELFQAIVDSQKNKVIQKVNSADCVSTDQLCSLQSESKDSNFKTLESDNSNMDHNDKKIIYNPVFSTKIPNYEILIKSSMLNSDDSSKLGECDESKVNTETCEVTEKRTPVQIDKLCNQFESKECCDNNSLENICSCADQIHCNKTETYNPSGFYDVQKDEVPIKSPLFKTDIESSKLPRDENNLPVNINVDPSTIIDKKMSIQPCSTNEFNTTSLNVDLLNSIHQHGYYNLSSLQLSFLSHCLSGQDMIFYSYPCVGKSTICLISVLQRINTDLNECQAIVLVPTLVLAMSVQKMIKSLGKSLNVFASTANDFHEVSPVPHVIVSTPRDLNDIINVHLLCKDFIKMLVIDDADEMLKCYGFSNQIRNVLLFLNNGCQLIVVSASKLEEIFDQFSDVMKNTAHIIMYDEKPFLEGVSQYYVNVSEEWKFDAVGELYDLLNFVRAVVYCNSWNKCVEIALNKHIKKCLVIPIQNKMAAGQRQKILDQFRSGTSKLLITTELLRGEDFSDVEWVINYDFPKNPEEYVRKIVGFFRRRVNVINFITLNDTIAKERIESAFEKQMLYFPENANDLCVPDIKPINDLILST